MSAINSQIGGNHYKDCAIQPVEYIHANGIGYFEGCAIKYLTRWKSKGGVQDLEKAKHYIELLIEFESQENHVEVIGDDEGWIQWGGGEFPPVSPETIVEVRYSSEIAPSRRSDKAINLLWNHDGAMDDIIAYRVVNKA